MWKEQEWQDTFRHCVSLYVGEQRIVRPNEEQTHYDDEQKDYEVIKCSC